MSVAGDSPLRILMLLNRVPYPLKDGGAVCTFSSVKGYAETGCVVHLLAMNTSKHFVEEKTVQEVLGKFGMVETVYVDNRIEPVSAFLNLFSDKSFVISRFISEEFDRKLTEILKTNEFDVIHIDGLPPSAYIRTARKYSKAKIVMRAHNVEHVIWERIVVQERNPLKKFYLNIQTKRLKKYESSSFTQCDLVLAISKEDEVTIKQCSQSAKTIVVPAGIEVSDDPPTQSISNNLFFIGSFDWVPNLQGLEWFFENVWKNITRNYPLLKFVIAGKKMPDSIKNLESGDVVIAGEVPNAKQFILEQGILIVPLISGSGIRIKIIEALALGKIVIATNIAAEGLGLTDGENVLIANNSSQFIGQIGKCLNDTAFRKKIGRNAHQFALNNFQNKRIFESLMNTYKRLKS